MKFSPIALLVVSLPCIFAGGCSPAEDEITNSEPPRREITFKGEPLPAYFGTWKDAKADLRYSFDKSGDYTYKGTMSTPAGPQPVEMSGKWAVEGETLFLKDSKGETYDYDLKVSGSEMTLKTRGQRKFEYKYKKQ